MSEGCNYIKEETPTQVFSGKFYEISKNTFFTEHLRNLSHSFISQMRLLEKWIKVTILLSFHFANPSQKN